MPSFAHLGLPLSLAPHARLIRRVFTGAGSLQSASFRQEILCKEETTTTRPAVHLPGQIERATNGTEHQPLRAEIESILAPTYTHAPTVAYHIKNASVFDGCVFAGNLKHFVADRGIFGKGTEPRRLDVAALASSTVGCRYFGHWLRDDCLQYMLAEHAAPPLCIRTQEYHHKDAYAGCFGQDWTPTDRAFVKELIVYQDFSQNASKRSRVDALRKRIAQAFPASPRKRDLVYLRRGNTGVRRVVADEAALIEFLEKRGFAILDVSAPVDTLLDVLTRAKLVVSMEGSQIAHCCLAIPLDAALIVMEPADRFTAIHRHWADSLGIGFGFVVGELGADGYVFSGDEILKTADLLLQ